MRPSFGGGRCCTGPSSSSSAKCSGTISTISSSDSRRALAMYKKLNIPPLGIVENMSHFVCPDCGHEADIFGHGGGERMATDLNVPFLGRIPIYQPIREGSDTGVPLVIAEPES